MCKRKAKTPVTCLVSKRSFDGEQSQASCWRMKCRLILGVGCLLGIAKSHLLKTPSFAAWIRNCCATHGSLKSCGLKGAGRTCSTENCFPPLAILMNQEVVASCKGSNQSRLYFRAHEAGFGVGGGGGC